MKFGFGVPTRGPLANPDSIAALARKGEELGFGFVSVRDHVVIPRSIHGYVRRTSPRMHSVVRNAREAGFLHHAQRVAAR